MHHSLHIETADTNLPVSKHFVHNHVFHYIHRVGFGVDIHYGKVIVRIFFRTVFVTDGYVVPFVLGKHHVALYRFVSFTQSQKHFTSIDGGEREEQPVLADGHDDSVALTVEPHTDGHVLVFKCVCCFGVAGAAVELVCHVGIGLIHRRVVEFALDNEVVGVAQCIAVEHFVVSDVHVVAVQIGENAIFWTGHAENLRTPKVLHHSDDVSLIGHFLNLLFLLVAVGAEGLCTHFVFTVRGE